MKLLNHPTRPGPDRPVERPGDTGDEHPVDPRVFAVQRLGAALVGIALLVFGLLGSTTGVPLLATHGERVLGLSSNGLLSALSLVVAAVLIGAAVRGPRIASTVMIVLGVLFLLSALVNLAVLRTSLNILAFAMSNVLFSIVVGLFLLVLGCYGRVSGALPEDSPYAHAHPHLDEPPELPETAEEVAAEAAMRRAEIAVCEHRGTEDDRRRVAAMALVHTRADRRRTWMAFDSAAQEPAASRRTGRRR
jgi:Domain of unknown function (DUF4383)